MIKFHLIRERDIKECPYCKETKWQSIWYKKMHYKESKCKHKTTVKVNFIGSGHDVGLEEKLRQTYQQHT